MKTIKALLNTSDDPFMGLLAGRSTSLENGVERQMEDIGEIVTLYQIMGDQPNTATPSTSLENSSPPSSNDPSIVCTHSGWVSRPPNRFS